jgi:hypothetical protein
MASKDIRKKGRMIVERRVDWVAWSIAIVVAAMTVLYRIAPYYLNGGPQQSTLWNFVPIGALALFAGARLRTPWAFLLPLGAMFLSDLLLIRPVAELGYSAFGWGRLLIYGCLALYFFSGRLLPRQGFTPEPTLLAALGSSTAFFLITNFAVWLSDTSLYTKDGAGLIACYVAAIPFHQNTLSSDLLYSFALFGLHALATRPQTAAQENPA